MSFGRWHDIFLSKEPNSALEAPLGASVLSPLPAPLSSSDLSLSSDLPLATRQMNSRSSMRPSPTPCPPKRSAATPPLCPSKRCAPTSLEGRWHEWQRRGESVPLTVSVVPKKDPWSSVRVSEVLQPPGDFLLYFSHDALHTLCTNSNNWAAGAKRLWTKMIPDEMFNYFNPAV